MKRILTALCLVLLLDMPLSADVRADTVVIVNAKNATQSLSASDVRKLFLGKSRVLPDGSRAVLVSFEPISSEFNKRALRKKDSQVKAAWSRLLFSGRAQPPREFSSASEAVAFVAANTSAVGYVNESELTDEVKVVYALK